MLHRVTKIITRQRRNSLLRASCHGTAASSFQQKNDWTNINYRIGNARSTSRLLEIYAKDNHKFTRSSYVMTLGRLAKSRAQYHRLSQSDKQHFDELVHDILNQQHELSPREFSNVFYGLAKTRAPIPVLTKVADYFVDVIDVSKLTMTELSMTAYAIAVSRLQSDLPKVFAHLESELLVRLAAEGQPQHAANVIWSCSTIGNYNSYLYAIVKDMVVSSDLNTYKPQELSNIVWAFARSYPNHASPIFSSIGTHLTTRSLDDFNTQNIANIVAGFAKAEQQLPESVLTAVVEHLNQYHSNWLDMPQNLCNLLWAFGLLEASHYLQPEITTILHHLNTQHKTLPLLEQRQIYQFMLDYIASTDEPIDSTFPQLFCSTREAMLKDDGNQLQRSTFVHDNLTLLTKALQERNIAYSTNVMTEIGYQVDLLLDVNTSTPGVVIMIDGPARFFKRKERLRSLMKKRHLRAFGYKVLSVPYNTTTPAMIDKLVQSVSTKPT